MPPLALAAALAAHALSHVARHVRSAASLALVHAANATMAAALALQDSDGLRAVVRDVDWRIEDSRAPWPTERPVECECGRRETCAGGDA